MSPKAQAASDTWARLSDPIQAAGFTVTPNLLIDSYIRLGMTAAELALVLLLWRHWWRYDDPPFLRVETIKERMGYRNERQVQRLVSTLERKKLLRRTEPLKAGVRVNAYDLRPLVERLEATAPAAPVAVA